jgi:rRNA pseudouridine-1189 N-methylase Emg1 (Nep1/Mra1 family)
MLLKILLEIKIPSNRVYELLLRKHNENIKAHVEQRHKFTILSKRGQMKRKAVYGEHYNKCYVTFILETGKAE